MNTGSRNLVRFLRPSSPLLLRWGLADYDDQAIVAHLLNQYLGDHGVPTAAQLHVCQSLADALYTLGALMATYTLVAKLI